jgi:formylglycine-generating enzyme required for sulfatase activity
MCYPPLSEIKPGMTIPGDWIKRAGYRLPTEQEWEYACRSGVSASRFWGEGAANSIHYAWFLQNSGNRAQPVGQLKPNNYGLFDMLGNVAERCHDIYGPYQAKDAPESESAIIESPGRVMRGGNFGDIDANIRSARRYANGPLDQWALLGFRPVRTVKP